MSSLALQPELLLNQRLWPELSALQLLYYHYLVIVHSSCHCATDLSLCNDLLIGAVFLSLCKYHVIKAKIERFAISLLLCMREPDIAT